jgi:hypothetical protein
MRKPPGIEQGLGYLRVETVEADDNDLRDDDYLTPSAETTASPAGPA